MAKLKNSKVLKATHDKSSVAGLPFVAAADVVDPALASLFKASTIPVDSQKLSLAALGSGARLGHDGVPSPEGEETYETASQSANRVRKGHNVGYGAEHTRNATTDDFQYSNPGPETQGRLRKRKRKQVDEDVEDAYMRRHGMDVLREGKRYQIEETTRPTADVNTATGAGVGLRLGLGIGSPGSNDGRDGNGMDAESDNGGEGSGREYSRGDDDAIGNDTFVNRQTRGGCNTVLQHESLVPSRESIELEKSSRTVFLANVSTIAITTKSARKTLISHLTSFIPSLPTDSVEHKLESLRFRSVAFTSSAVPKKAAFAKKELMDSTTKSTNAYAVYSTTLAVREAVAKLNGTVILDRHLRVDSVAHPARADHRRCAFVGNLGFVDDESMINASEESNGSKRPRKVKEPSDIEEGLWRQFEKAGRVESVRVIRDQQTRVGKGIAYVQFTDPNDVEAALLFNEKKYPPLLPRILRVTRAKSIKKTSSASNTINPKQSFSNSNSARIYNPRINSKVRSLQGRAGKLLGRAAAAQFKAPGSTNIGNEQGSRNMIQSPESIVFEGYRASNKNGKEGMRTGGSGKKKGKLRSRSSKRGTAWKRSGGKKGVQDLWGVLDPKHDPIRSSSYKKECITSEVVQYVQLAFDPLGCTTK
ncbi:MAG: hypothetical protein M1812_001521 [Candelaria pacifica]|nr:MAG: hypothetical protein M1812_001521 [Candelaria pacifica]